MIITKNGNYIYNAFMPNTDWTGEAIQIIDDNSELGQKIIGFIPYVKLIYTNGLVTDCEDGKTVEPIDPPELPPSLEDRVADLEAENETISEVLDALLMGDIEV